MAPSRMTANTPVTHTLTRNFTCNPTTIGIGPVANTCNLVFTCTRIQPNQIWRVENIQGVGNTYVQVPCIDVEFVDLQNQSYVKHFVGQWGNVALDCFSVGVQYTFSMKYTWESNNAVVIK
jgi:hypothetical protein